MDVWNIVSVSFCPTFWEICLDFTFLTLHTTGMWRSFFWDSRSFLGSHLWPLASRQKPDCWHFMSKEMNGNQLTHIISLFSALNLKTTHYSTWHSIILNLSGIPLGKSDFFCLYPLCVQSKRQLFSALLNFLNPYSRNVWKSICYWLRPHFLVFLPLHLLNVLSKILMGSRKEEEINILANLPSIIRYLHTVLKSIYRLLSFPLYMHTFYINLVQISIMYACMYGWMDGCISAYTNMYVWFFFLSFHSFGVKICKLKKNHQYQRHKVLCIIFQGERA